MLDMQLHVNRKSHTFLQLHVKLLRVKRKKKASEMTVLEHMQSIAALGGRARAAKLSAEAQSAIGRKAGLVGGRARAQKLGAAKRRAIAQKAAKTRWGKK
jgi:hypothetical protein